MGSGWPGRLGAVPVDVLDELRSLPGAMVLVGPADRQVNRLPTMQATGALAAWYRAGVRVLVPLRVGAPHRAAGREDGDTEPAPVADGQWLGVWALGARGHGEYLDRDDLTMFTRVARQAAVLIDYARLYQEHRVTKSSE